ncbi:cytochrome b [Pseudomonas sp. zfem002]|uniref:cytochrome b n=1 Tax=Pseudomonas sp. zfem002 TaxID=3078197 RepID=UPI0029279E2C|nr:cytochrome b [Pseudomonas sp. zfem002]MDU9394204.1 cytochrome b [Pseudomonas sp. zfem002]
MKRESSTDRYGRLSIVMHWSMVLLFIGIYACVEWRDALPKGHALKGPLLGFHGLLGLAVFALVWVRLLGRLAPRPPIRPRPAAWQNAVASLTHLGLYGLMIVTPVLAWLMLGAAGKPLPYWDIALPAPIAEAPALARQLKGWHEWLGSAGYWLIGLHALAALVHHYWLKDNTLKRMLPGG